ncbi:Nicotinate-nucleotide--dimethylbenzimidazole phosphoribosyltransferase [Aliiroseovarius sp. xm-m-379]|uniref:nicotinate-nucleotide--dimethylbenzimidazole phosphoribosyltransferase n=1 Tax=unclassified Aliiroseovarius TaxID=2623558 RepID=UPI00156900BD|nr:MULTISPECIES: nicotinate-nucleotide--dimethylbenzimidazole phosphoribosyltransferase [unclassified Aliiroseovarius]NRP12073.1 Nicotinate-nucleotide--dimethylbenzimidazole phosphoribosyltransferase [Aliiroseovarius sp. xm-d-517]NRP25301.1 Nicotinate-nucleotide--dimethylbenzimidazole phosphoribosyltransferase [Aliiroseovarius sp. xm-m-379]NRP30971.1 Nicotinate-nucleotide--dimethylbenzimidazole phosphoribosyltransferase [Aliiroseovarius sp. xm-m-314]NRP34100.1 Nicotinate-nucleotide--dimethylben
MSDKSFSTLAEFKALLDGARGADTAAEAAAQDRNGQLTKPPGALGRLEDLAIWYASWRGNGRPALEAPQVIVFAGNHGVTARGVSAFPAEVTEQMVLNFQHGGAAINQLSKAFGAKMDVHALSLDKPTADFTQGPAMSEDEVVAALNAGWEAVDPACDLLVTGEMGIGNTTSAAAIAHALFGGAPGDWTGRGTGVDDAGIDLKTRVVAEGLAANPQASEDGLEALRCLGGREIAAMAGAIARARVEGIPVILDGFICSAAAACLSAVVPGALDHAVAGHVSAEAAHERVLTHIGKAPLLSLGMRLGEGSGAALAIGVLKGAIACHSGMATFAEAGVSDG